MKIVHKNILLISLVLLPFLSYSQKKSVLVKSLTFPQLQDSMQLHPKPILLRLSTDWCVYCKLQDKQIEKSDSLQKILQNNFYYVEMDAETKATISFNGRQYQSRSNGLSKGVHELAEALGKENGQIGYPVIVVLNERYKMLYRYQGLMEKKELIKVLLLTTEMK